MADPPSLLGDRRSQWSRPPGRRNHAAAQARRLAALRESLLQLPPRLAPVLAAQADAARCHDLLQLELHQVLESMVEHAA